jgi:hypothetical protein
MLCGLLPWSMLLLTSSRLCIDTLSVPIKASNYGMTRDKSEDPFLFLSCRRRLNSVVILNLRRRSKQGLSQNAQSTVSQSKGISESSESRISCSRTSR